MKLKKFTATKVHGYLNFDINFFDETTFLVGINGSGKTSALKLILGLASPSWINLNQISFETATLICSINEFDEVIIRATSPERNYIEIAIEPFEIKPHRFQRIEIPQIHLSASKFELRQLLTSIIRQEQIFHKNQVVKKISELPTPIFLGLDRRIYEGREIDFLNIDNLTRDRELTEPLKSNLFDSLKDVEKILFENYFQFTQKQSGINDELKNQIIHSSFQLLNESQIDLKMIADPSNLRDKRRQVEKAANKIGVPGVKEQLDVFFARMERVQVILEKKAKDKKKQSEFDKDELQALQTWFINMPQLQRIDTIISLYEKSEQEIQQEFLPFRKFESLTNKFIEESNKRLQIGNNGELIVKLPDESEGNVFRLSSGEQQILVMLAQLVFSENKKSEGSIFIIDEPELSLHLEWQEIFIRSLKEASPNTQFILATHSPTIIGEISNQKFCQDLSQNNISKA